MEIYGRTLWTKSPRFTRNKKLSYYKEYFKFNRIFCCNMPKITVSIIIVYFSGWKDFEKCLQSIKLYRSKYLSEVIIVNNGRKPIKNKILKILPKAIYIKNKL